MEVVPGLYQAMVPIPDSSLGFLDAHLVRAEPGHLLLDYIHLVYPDRRVHGGEVITAGEFLLEWIRGRSSARQGSGVVDCQSCHGRGCIGQL